MPPSHLIHRLGCNLYLWSQIDQIAFLENSLKPSLHSWIHSGFVDEFFWTQFDARGPHLFLIFSADHPLDALEHGLRGLLEARPHETGQEAALEPAELERRHRDCHGKTLCVVDGFEGFAEAGSYEIFEHPRWGYPYSLGNPDTAQGTWMAESPLWREWSAINLWTLDLLGSPTLAPALQWISAVDQVLGSDRAADFWRHCLHSLLPGLTMLEELESVDPVQISCFIDEKSFDLLRRLWQLDQLPVPDPGIIVGSTLEAADTTARWRLLREIVFVTLRQLGLEVRQQARIYTFALQRWLGVALSSGNSQRTVD